MRKRKNERKKFIDKINRMYTPRVTCRDCMCDIKH